MQKSLETIAREVGSLNIPSNFVRSLKIILELNIAGATSEDVAKVEALIDGPTPEPTPEPKPEPVVSPQSVGFPDTHAKEKNGIFTRTAKS
jgi:hypothetical protein